MLVLATRIRKKDSPRKFCKISVDIKSYFCKEEIFFVTNRQKIDEKYYYWLKSSRTEKKIKYTFQRGETFSISENFS